MYYYVRKYSRRVFLLLAVCFSLTISALAFDTPKQSSIALLSSNVASTSGMVPSAAAVSAAAKVLAVQREEEAREQAFQEQVHSLLYSSLSQRTVAYNSSFSADEAVRSAGRPLGKFKLTFYCPCVKCNGRSDGLTKSGTTAVEGRTIAVDPRVIPLGSRVYIDGYGVFIAEDTGSAIKSNKIDVFLDSHSRCFENGVAHANVYLLG